MEGRQQWTFAQRLLFHGDKTGRVLGCIRDRQSRGERVAFSDDFCREVLQTIDLHGFPLLGVRLYEESQERLLRSVTASLLREPSAAYAQLVYAASFGDELMVDYLINRAGVCPMFPYMVNTPLEYAAAMGHVEVVRCLLRHPDVDPGMYSVENMGQPPMYMALQSIKNLTRRFGGRKDVTPYWTVVEELLRAANGRPIMAEAGFKAMVVTAPMPLLRAIAAAEPTYMTQAAPRMLAAIIKRGTLTWSEDEWCARYELVRSFLASTHPLAKLQKENE